MEDQEILEAAKSLYQKIQTVQKLTQERSEAERALGVEFRVDECNSRRQDLMEKYNPEISKLNSEISALQQALLTGVKAA